MSGLADLVREDLAGVEELRGLVGDEDDLDLVLGLSDRLPRVRPVLVALAARANGASEAVDRDLQHTAELLHMALVLHDVALGKEGGRRRRMAKRVVRRSVGWLGGHQLSLRALELARHTPNPEVLGEVVDTLREFSDGHALSRDLHARGVAPTRHDWLDHVDRHTGALFSFCCRSGAHLGHKDAAAVAALGRYGRHVGRQWNLAEDLHKLRGPDGAEHLRQRAESGRPVLAVAAAAEEDAAIAAAWARLVERGEVDLARELAAEILASGAAGAVREALAKEGWVARQALDGLPQTPYRKGLEALASGLSRVH